MADYCVKGKGVINIMIDGISWKLDSDSAIEIIPSNQEREAGNYGEFTIKDRSPSFNGTFRVPAGFPIKKAQELCGVRVTVELYDGRIFELASASNVSTDPYDGRTGLLPLTFIGEFMEERVNSAA